MVITHNLLAMDAGRQFNINTKNKAKSTEKLSSGYKINRAADDAAGLSISEKMRWQIRGLNRGSENIQDGISLVQVADGALNEVHAMIHRIRELAVEAANGTNSYEDRQYIQSEVDEIKQEIKRTFRTTDFNGNHIFTAPYTIDACGEPTDIQVFNVNQNMTLNDNGGLIINYSRYTWGELGANISNGVFTADFEYNKVLDSGERMHLRAYEGDTIEEIKRIYNVETDEEGMYVDEVPAAHWAGKGSGAKWANTEEIHQDGDEFYFEYNGTTISFLALSDDDMDTIIGKLKPQELVSDITTFYEAEAFGGDKEYAVNSSGAVSNMVLDVTEYNKYGIAGYKYEISADTTGVSIRQLVGNDQINHKKIAWSDFTNIDSGEPFSFTDWGLEDEGSNPQTFSSLATYRYTDDTFTNMEKPLSFTFTVKDEASRDGIIAGLNGITLTSGSVQAPLRAGGTTDNSNVSVTSHSGLTFDVQRDMLKRTFDDSVSPIEGDVTRTRNYSGTVDSYKLTESGYVLDKTYRLFTDSYTYYNCEGDAVMSGAGSRHIEIDSSNAEKPEKITIIDQEGKEIEYTTQFAKENVTLTADYARICMLYDNSSDDYDGSVNSNTHINIQPSDEATRTFSKNPASQGISYRTYFEAMPGEYPDKKLHIQAGSQQDNGIDLEWKCMSLASIGLGAANVATRSEALRTLKRCDIALERVSENRSTFGALQNRLEHAYNVNSYTSENLDASESRIRDTDMAEEMVKHTKHSVLEQAGQSMLSQANQSVQSVLNILGS